MCLGVLIWPFSPAWDTVKLTQKVGFICPFVVDDPTNLGATMVDAQALCLSIFNLSPTQKTCLFTDGIIMVIKLTCLSVCLSVIITYHDHRINTHVITSLLPVITVIMGHYHLSVLLQ